MSRKRSFSYTIDKTNAVDSPEGVKDAGKSLRSTPLTELEDVTAAA